MWYLRRKGEYCQEVVDELVQRHKRDVKKSTGGRKPKTNKAREGFDFSRDT
jgi:hypothetical protein